MFDRKDMVDAAMKPRHLTSTGKTLQDRLLQREGNRSIQEEADTQCLDVSKAFPAVSSVLPLSNLYQVQCLEKPVAQAYGCNNEATATGFNG